MLLGLSHYLESNLLDTSKHWAHDKPTAITKNDNLWNANVVYMLYIYIYIYFKDRVVKFKTNYFYNDTLPKIFHLKGQHCYCSIVFKGV